MNAGMWLKTPHTSKKKTIIMKKIYSLALMMMLSIGSCYATAVKVIMNNVSKTMTLVNKESGAVVETGEPEGTTYSFEAAPGTYVLVGFGTDGTTVNGSIEFDINDQAEQEISIFTCTAYATNKEWTIGEDYEFSVSVKSVNKPRLLTLGNSVTAGRKTFLAVKGDSYLAEMKPTEKHPDNMSFYKGGTVTFNATVSGEIPVGAEYSITVPSKAELSLGMKFVHFTDFTTVLPESVKENGNTKTVTYRLANKQVYNFRTWLKDGLTQAGYFTMSTDETARPELVFTEDDYAAFGAKTIQHDVKWNNGYETGDIYVNINERGHLRLNIGDTFDAHAMRTWQLTDSSVGNYFFEPDFHYTVLDVNGNPSTGVIEIDNANTTTSPWSTIKAIGKGTAIVLVTYDAIGLNYYSGATKKDFLGGQYWSAIWPENTAAFVVTVGDNTSAISPNMLINQKYNESTMKNAGEYLDAEHDVFYFLDSEGSTTYSFVPEGVEKVEIAYPTIGEQMATYTGFSEDGVLRDGKTYTLTLKAGRQIVRLTDASGNCVYQVITAKPCHMEITNLTREGSKTFQPGDQVKVQYSGLFHPANKLAGIYNMSAYVTYNGTPNGDSAYGSGSQYTFASTEKAQAVTIDIPADYDIEKNGEYVLSEGVIQVKGFGDPIGNHRLISREAGRSANFTAVSHETYFGQLPDVRIALTAEDVITFEDVDLKGEDYWNGSDESGLFVANDDFSFMNYYNKEYMSWNGFALSATTGTDYSGWGTPSEFNSCVGGGLASKQFAVGYYSEYNHSVDGQAPAIFATKAYKPEYVYVTNSANSYLSMLNGDEFAKKFTDEDWFLLKITGYTNDGAETGHVDFYLAKDGKILKDWEKIDLTSLGAVDYIEFTMSSSDTSWGFMNTPAYFCIDNLKAQLTDDIPTGIECITEKKADTTMEGVYTIHGVKLNKPQHGVNIIRMSDGTTKRFMTR